MPEYEFSYSDVELSINFVTAAAIEGRETADPGSLKISRQDSILSLSSGHFCDNTSANCRCAFSGGIFGLLK